MTNNNDELKMMILQQGNGVSMNEIMDYISQNFIPLSSLKKFIEENKKSQWDKSPRFIDGVDMWGERYAEIDGDKVNGFNQALKLLKDKFIHE